MDTEQALVAALTKSQDEPTARGFFDMDNSEGLLKHKQRVQDEAAARAAEEAEEEARLEAEIEDEMQMEQDIEVELRTRRQLQEQERIRYGIDLEEEEEEEEDHRDTLGSAYGLALLRGAQEEITNTLSASQLSQTRVGMAEAFHSPRLAAHSYADQEVPWPQVETIHGDDDERETRMVHLRRQAASEEAALAEHNADRWLHSSHSRRSRQGSAHGRRPVSRARSSPSPFVRAGADSADVNSAFGLLSDTAGRSSVGSLSQGFSHSKRIGGQRPPIRGAERAALVEARSNARVQKRLDARRVGRAKQKSVKSIGKSKRVSEMHNRDINLDKGPSTALLYGLKGTRSELRYVSGMGLHKTQIRAITRQVHDDASLTGVELAQKRAHQEKLRAADDKSQRRVGGKYGILAQHTTDVVRELSKAQASTVYRQQKVEQQQGTAGGGERGAEAQSPEHYYEIDTSGKTVKVLEVLDHKPPVDEERVGDEFTEATSLTAQYAKISSEPPVIPTVSPATLSLLSKGVASELASLYGLEAMERNEEPLTLVRSSSAGFTLTEGLSGIVTVSGGPDPDTIKDKWRRREALEHKAERDRAKQLMEEQARQQRRQNTSAQPTQTKRSRAGRKGPFSMRTASVSLEDLAAKRRSVRRRRGQGSITSLAARQAQAAGTVPLPDIIRQAASQSSAPVHVGPKQTESRFAGLQSAADAGEEDFDFNTDDTIRAVAQSAVRRSSSNQTLKQSANNKSTRNFDVVNDPQRGTTFMTGADDEDEDDEDEDSAPAHDSTFIWNGDGLAQGRSDNEMRSVRQAAKYLPSLLATQPVLMPATVDVNAVLLLASQSVHFSEESLFDYHTVARLTRIITKYEQKDPQTTSEHKDAEIDQMKAQVSALKKRHASSHMMIKVWRPFFFSENCRNLLHDTFWWVLWRFFGRDAYSLSKRDPTYDAPDEKDMKPVKWRASEQAQSERAMMDKVFERISDTFVNLFWSVPATGGQKDTFLQVFFDGLAQAVFYSLCRAYPKSVHQFNLSFRLQLADLLAQWTLGHPPADTPQRVRMWQTWAQVLGSEVMNAVDVEPDNMLDMIHNPAPRSDTMRVLSELLDKQSDLGGATRRGSVVQSYSGNDLRITSATPQGSSTHGRNSDDNQNTTVAVRSGVAHAEMFGGDAETFAAPTETIMPVEVYKQAKTFKHSLLMANYIARRQFHSTRKDTSVKVPLTVALPSAMAERERKENLIREQQEEHQAWLDLAPQERSRIERETGRKGFHSKIPPDVIANSQSSWQRSQAMSRGREQMQRMVYEEHVITNGLRRLYERRVGHFQRKEKMIDKKFKEKQAHLSREHSEALRKAHEVASALVRDREKAMDQEAANKTRLEAFDGEAQSMMSRTMITVKAGEDTSGLSLPVGSGGGLPEVHMKSTYQRGSAQRVSVAGTTPRHGGHSG